MASRQTGPLPLSRLLERAIDPLVAERGFGAADLVSSWDEVIGARYAAATEPEKIAWPRGRDGRGVLTIRVDGPIAIYLQHDRGQIIERVNRFLGHGAIGDIRIVQRPKARPVARRGEVSLPIEERAAVAEIVRSVEHEPMRAALTRLGEAIRACRLARE